MKLHKLLSLTMMFFVVLLSAQTTANRFFYELNYKPKKGIDSLQKTVMILDITDKKSIYRDYLTVSQDSVLKIEVEKIPVVVEPDDNTGGSTGGGVIDPPRPSKPKKGFWAWLGGLFK